MKYVAFAIALVGCAATTPVLAVTPVAISQFTFNGDCGDCTGTGTGTLTLQNYTLGNSLDVSNFVEWTYTSNLVSYDITQVGYMYGVLDNLPGPANVSFGTGQIDAPPFFFSSFTGEGNFWNTGDQRPRDYGPDHTWALAAAPEPASWAMMVAGFGMIGAMVRRRKVAVSFA